MSDQRRTNEASGGAADHQPRDQRNRAKSTRGLDPAPARSPAEQRTDFATDLLRQFLVPSSDSDLENEVRRLSRKPAYRDLFPGAEETAALVPSVMGIARSFEPGPDGLMAGVEQRGAFLVVRQYKAVVTPWVRADAVEGGRCLGFLLAFVASLLRTRPESRVADPRRLRRLVVSLDSRLVEVWERTKRGADESALEIAVRMADTTRIVLGTKCEGAREQDEDVASVAYCLSVLERDRVVALPQEAIAELLDLTRHQAVSETIARLVRWRFLARVAKHDRKLGLAATYRVRSRKDDGIFQVVDRQQRGQRRQGEDTERT